MMTLLLSPAIAYCENYLFPTDIVPVNTFDAQIGVGERDYKNKFETLFLGLPVRINGYIKTTTEIAMLRYGITENTHIGVLGIKNQLEITSKTGSGSAFQADFNFKSNRAANPSIFVKHRILNDETSPLSLAAIANLRLNIANNNYTGLDLGLMAGWRFNEALRAYAEVTTLFTDQDKRADSQTLELGFHKQITPRITLVPYFEYNHFESVKGISAINYQKLGLKALVEVFPKTYLIPELQHFNVSAFSDLAGSKTSASFNEKAYAISLYHLF